MHLLDILVDTAGIDAGTPITITRGPSRSGAAVLHPWATCPLLSDTVDARTAVETTMGDLAASDRDLVCDCSNMAFGYRNTVDLGVLNEAHEIAQAYKPLTALDPMRRIATLRQRNARLRAIRRPALTGLAQAAATLVEAQDKSLSDDPNHDWWAGWALLKALTERANARSQTVPHPEVAALHRIAGTALVRRSTQLGTGVHNDETRVHDRLRSLWHAASASPAWFQGRSTLHDWTRALADPYDPTRENVLRLPAVARYSAAVRADRLIYLFPDPGATVDDVDWALGRHRSNPDLVSTTVDALLAARS